jgi:hypothetical protein
LLVSKPSPLLESDEELDDELADEDDALDEELPSSSTFRSCVLEMNTLFESLRGVRITLVCPISKSCSLFSTSISADDCFDEEAFLTNLVPLGVDPLTLPANASSSTEDTTLNVHMFNSRSQIMNDRINPNHEVMNKFPSSVDWPPGLVENPTLMPFNANDRIAKPPSIDHSFRSRWLLQSSNTFI